MEDNRKTICARLTPPGRGAVAVIGLVGPSAESVLNELFRPASGNRFSETTARGIVYGVWRSTGEDLIVSRRGKNRFEVHCHGGNSACTAILTSFESSDVNQVTSLDFARSSADAWSVSTQLTLAKATTARTARILLDQAKILPLAINQIRTLVESKELETALARVEEMLVWSDFGIHLTRPRSIVLCGKPNVGKSSLVNAIVGFQRAIVHGEAGTTRDVVSQSTAIAGWPVELKDTAGIRDATNAIEAIGIQNAKTQLGLANLRIGVFELSSEWSQADQDLLDLINPHLIVFNKSDLANALPSPSNRPAGLKTSVETGEGIDWLIESLGRLLVPSLPKPGQAFPVSNTQTQKLREIASCLANQKIQSDLQIDDLSMDDA